MNHRFSFRAFHKKGYMFEVSKIDFANGKLLGVQHVRYDIIEDVTLMQCTGLKDKNNELIYEGDILALSPYNEEHHLRFVVKFGKGTWDSGYYEYQGFYLDTLNGYSDGNGGILFDDRIEILGNFYEHPELLK